MVEKGEQYNQLILPNRNQWFIDWELKNMGVARGVTRYGRDYYQRLTDQLLLEPHLLLPTVPTYGVYSTPLQMWQSLRQNVANPLKQS